MYWPGWEEQVRNAVASCAICKKHRHHNARLPLFPVLIPDYYYYLLLITFQLVSADLFEFSQVYLLAAGGLLQQVAVRRPDEIDHLLSANW